MLIIAEVAARIDVTEGATVVFDESLELCLDCCICHRSLRTVIFDGDSGEAQCTPTGHTFPGKIIDKVVDGSAVVYRLEYWYEPFLDVKHGKYRLPQPSHNHGCVYFTVHCPQCDGYSRCSVTRDTPRPYSKQCECGHVLYVDSEKMPVVSRVEAGLSHAA